MSSRPGLDGRIGRSLVWNREVDPLNLLVRDMAHLETPPPSVLIPLFDLDLRENAADDEEYGDR